MATDTAPAVTVNTASTRPVRPVLWFAVVGSLLAAFELLVLVRWAIGPHFKATPTGSDHISSEYHAFLIALQVVVTALIVPCAWYLVIRPWRREGHLTTEGMFAISAALLFFWDMSMNFTSVTLFYNSNLVNFGAWANGSWPGWTSPGANLLPEPVFIVLPAYTTLVYVQVIFVLWLVRKAEARWSGLSRGTTIVCLIVGLTITDTIVEGAVLRTGVYAYPGAIRQITLFAGRTYQIPFSETFFFGGLGLGAIAAMLHFRFRDGSTLPERGLALVRASDRNRQWIKFAAVFGAIHLSFVILYVIPQQFFATHSGPFPHGYPSYLVNNMCQAGATGHECPGPGVLIHRP